MSLILELEFIGVCLNPAISCACRVLDEVLQKLVHLVQEEECVSVSKAHTHTHTPLFPVRNLHTFKTHTHTLTEYKSFLTVCCVYYSTSDSSTLSPFLLISLLWGT